MIAQQVSVIDLFAATGAYLNGHFALTSGLHSPEYLQCALVLRFPEHAERLGRDLAARLGSLAPQGIDAVVAPAMGGLIIGHEVARAIGVPFLFTERDDTRAMVLRRGFSISPSLKVVVVEDVVTTGGSTREVIDLIRAAGGTVVAAGSIIDRSGGRADVGAPRVALHTLAVQTWPQDQCPLCREGSVAVKPGSRK